MAAAACGVLSRYVKEAAAETEARSAGVVALPLMPGADVSTTQEEQEPATSGASQMTIFYGGRVLVLDDVTTDRAAGLLQVAATTAAADLPVARKASLQRFMEKRKGRVAARAAAATYSRPDDGARSACPDRLALAL